MSYQYHDLHKLTTAGSKWDGMQRTGLADQIGVWQISSSQILYRDPLLVVVAVSELADCRRSDPDHVTDVCLQRAEMSGMGRAACQPILVEEWTCSKGRRMLDIRYVRIVRDGHF